MTRKQTRKPKQIPDPRTMTVKPSSYQPSRAELREEVDMPGLSLKQAGKAFMRPFRLDHGKD